MTGISTGLRELDSFTHGLQTGHLTVIASRPSMGCTTLLNGICRNVAIVDGHPTTVFTFEGAKEDSGRRVMEEYHPRFAQCREEAPHAI
ncbi:DnaB-like helicase C-terminal domain-containing protein [Streptomyces sp. cg2]|uniref:DnaB-like helicase C-terminal domain-containing protein n=1 Tax=Streptomyces sp. cg2 TaxID=3238799 RepID=UPI0034E2BEC0